MLLAERHLTWITMAIASFFIFFYYNFTLRYWESDMVLVVCLFLGRCLSLLSWRVIILFLFSTRSRERPTELPDYSILCGCRAESGQANAASKKRASFSRIALVFFCSLIAASLFAFMWCSKRESNSNSSHHPFYIICVWLTRSRSSTSFTHFTSNFIYWLVQILILKIWGSVWWDQSKTKGDYNTSLFLSHLTRLLHLACLL